MIKIPFINKFITEDQEFYDAQINEELKYCNNSDIAIKFIEVGKLRRAFVIKTKEKTIILLFMKSDYKGINKALEKIRLNLALTKKENSLQNSSDNSLILDTSSKDKTIIEGNNGEKIILTVSTIEQLLINNKPLQVKEKIINRLFELSLQNDKEKQYLDFRKAGYDAGIQNYLIMSLYQENINLNDRLVNAISYYKAKEPKIYYLVNSFLRGNFEEMINYLKSLEHSISMNSIARICQNIIQAQEELPNRKYDLMIYRAGLGKTKDLSIGAKNSYQSFVSFGTSGGTLGEVIKDGSNPIAYKRILKKDDKAIPVDLIENLGIIYIDGTQENEFLLPPFDFQITDKSKEEDFDTYSIEETNKINPRELLDKRLDELEEYLKSNNYNEQYQRLKKEHDIITKKSKKIITGYNMKDIYYGLRPKTKKSKKIEDNFSER